MNAPPENAPRRIDVALGERSYPIFIGPGLLADAARWRARLRGRQALVVSNTTVAPLYLDIVARGLEAQQLQLGGLGRRGALGFGFRRQRCGVLRHVFLGKFALRTRRVTHD